MIELINYTFYILQNVTLLFDTEIKYKNVTIKNQEQKISDITERSARLNNQLAVRIHYIIIYIYKIII